MLPLIDIKFAHSIDSQKEINSFRICKIFKEWQNDDLIIRNLV